jgi:uncharacterized membrane protein YhaH (DUF805 family)
MSSTAVQLVFAGEILSGFSQAQVREKLGRRLRLDEPRLNKLFSGQRVVIKRDLSPAEAADWVQRFRAIGAVLHAVPAKAPGAEAPVSAAPKASPPAPAVAPAPAPQIPAPPPPARRTTVPPPDTSMMLSLVADSELPSPPPPSRAAAPSRAPAPAAAAPTSGPEEVTCPNCGERQSKRVICRSCLCDMPRTLASQKAEAEARRQARLEEQRARNEQRLAQEQARLSDDEGFENDADEPPPLLSLSLEGRMGRVRFLGSNALCLAVSLGLLLGLLALAVTVSKAAVLWGGVLAGLVIAWWGVRLTVLRLHDLNRSGWFALLQLVPGLNALFSLVLLLWPGNAEENDYGTPVDDARWFWAVFGVLVFGATTLLTTPQLWHMLTR